MRFWPWHQSMAACNVAAQWGKRFFFFFFHLNKKRFSKDLHDDFFLIPAPYHFAHLRCLKFFFIFFLILYIIYPPVEESLYNWCKSKLKDNVGKHVRSCVADIASSSLVSTLVVAWSFSSYTLYFFPRSVINPMASASSFLIPFRLGWLSFLLFLVQFTSLFSCIQIDFFYIMWYKNNLKQGRSTAAKFHVPLRPREM